MPATDVYTRVTERIVADLENGVRPWQQPWSGEIAAEHVTRPLRANGIPYRGVNVLLLWGEALDRGYGSSIWMTYNQAHELGAQVRRGEHGAPVVYANTFTKTETNTETGEEIERSIPFMKGYRVFNVEQIEGLPEHCYAKPIPPPRRRRPATNGWRRFFRRRTPRCGTAATGRFTRQVPTWCRCRHLWRFGTPKAITPRWPTRSRIGRATQRD